MKTSPNNPDLAFSGTGCRAAAFHLGTLIMPDEPGMLLKINVLSAISDGSITGAGYVSTMLPLSFKSSIKFESGTYKKYSKL